jgi:hypothetical protein
MKPLYLLRTLLVAGFLCCQCVPTHGQITIVKADIVTATAIGTTGTGYITPFGTNPIIHIGPAFGPAQIWDFRGYTFDPFNTVEFITPSAAPHLATFPRTNVVLKQWDEATQTNVYQYNELTDGEYLCLGTGNDQDTNLVAYDPPMPQLKFPMTLGTSWTYTGRSHSPYPGIVTQNSCKYTIDAFGTVQLPEGEFQALRLRSEYLTDTRTGISSSLSRGLGYYFFSKNLDWVYLYCDTNDIGNADVHTSGVGYQIGSSINTVEGRIPSDISLALRNYPNPFSRQTSISFQLAVSGNATLTVHDALGRVVQTLAEGWLDAGMHHYQFIPAATGNQSQSGVYVVRLTTRSKSATKPMILIR